MLLWLVLLLAPLARATWNTLYALEAGRVYLHLTNNDVVCLNFSVTGHDLQLKDRQQVARLTTPPQGSAIALYGDQLYAFAANTSDARDVCGHGSLGLSRYDPQTSVWEPVPLNTTTLVDTSFYRGASYLTPLGDDDEQMYVYGGICGSAGPVTNRLLSLNPTTGEVANISTATRPQPFYGAANLWAPNPQTQLVIGGQSNGGGWLSLLQLAMWTFDAGWSSRVAAVDAATTISSRRYALALPVFAPLANASHATVVDHYHTDSVLVLGGEAASGKSMPFVARLSTSSNDWSWSNVDTNLTKAEVMGAATIFNTLVVINGTTSVPAHGQYSVNLYDTTTFEPVGSLKEAVDAAAASEEPQGTPVATKAILGTVLPVSALVIMAAAAVFFVKKRKQGDKGDYDDYDYQIQNFYDQNRVNHHNVPPPALYGPGANDTSSTLEEASIKSWVRKRQEFEHQQNLRSYHNPSFLASAETLSSAATDDTKVTASEGSPRTSLQASPVLPSRPAAPHTRPPSQSRIDRSVTRLRKSLSFTGSQYGTLKKDTHAAAARRSPTLFDDEFAYESKSDDSDDDKAPDNDGHSLDENMDVQVLVSSKRRSVLRVVNPDLETIDDAPEDQSVVDLRQRVPSGPINHDV
ncbi:Galactose oxidase [[Candida] zeylanoides]